MKHADNPQIRFLVGEILQPCSRPLQPYSDAVCTFLAALAKKLRSSKIAKTYPDVASFGFFCREANLARLKREFFATEPRLRRGLGSVFHIAPANVPTNFAYSLVCGLLAGNANIVRVPQKEHPQIDILCEALRQTLDDKQHAAIRPLITVISYGRSDEISAQISNFCNGRVIWGGDTTVQTIRALPLPPRGVEVAFADRYSFAVMDAEAVLATPERVERLALDFYNDSYLMGQEACSSPHLVCWLGNKKQEAGELFWKKLAEVAQRKFELTPVDVVDKYTSFIEDLINRDHIASYRHFGNYLYVLNLKQLPGDIENLRGKAGYFYESELNSLEEVAGMVNAKVQTLTYYGLKKDDLADFVHRNSFLGIDRIVPVGRALDFSTHWDGYDLVRTLSRVFDIL